MSLIDCVYQRFPDLEIGELPEGLSFQQSKGDVSITSWSWRGPGIRRARLCDLQVPGKFTAETLVIYPDSDSDAPIFGTEYLRIGGKKFFGGIDFHPLSQDRDYLEKYISGYLEDFPDTSAKDSKFYDLGTYFSGKFWLKKSDADFYDEYTYWTLRFLTRYKKLLDEKTVTSDVLHLHRKYDLHMGENDPAHGILKAYFSKEFADFYVQEFLFDLTNRYENTDSL